MQCENQVGMAVEADVRNALQAVNSTRARLDAAGLARQSAEEQYASEQRQFQAGTSSVFLVLQRQTDLITARNREVRARMPISPKPWPISIAPPPTPSKRRALSCSKLSKHCPHHRNDEPARTDMPVLKYEMTRPSDIAK